MEELLFFAQKSKKGGLRLQALAIISEEEKTKRKSDGWFLKYLPDCR
jgi:hypothetical protein